MNRRLPVYLLLDCSESMIGEGLASVEKGLATMLSALRTDPHALETVCLSVITFDSEARVAVPLVPLLEFQSPKLRVRAGTALGSAISLLAKQIRTETTRTTADSKGDFRPLVLLLTDGQPTDEWKAALREIGKNIKPRPANIYAIGCGVDVDYAILQEVSDIVLKMADMSPASFAKLFIWLTASVASASQGTASYETGTIHLGRVKVNA